MGELMYKRPRNEITNFQLDLDELDVWDRRRLIRNMKKKKYTIAPPISCSHNFSPELFTQHYSFPQILQLFSEIEGNTDATQFTSSHFVHLNDGNVVNLCYHKTLSWPSSFQGSALCFIAQIYFPSTNVPPCTANITLAKNEIVETDLYRLVIEPMILSDLIVVNFTSEDRLRNVTKPIPRNASFYRYRYSFERQQFESST